MTVRMSESGVGVLGRGSHNMGLRDDFEMDRNNVGMGVNFGADEMSSVITSLSNSVTNSNSTKNSKSRTTNDPYSEHHHQRLSSSDHDLDRGRDRDRDRDREMLPPVKFNMLGQMQMRKSKPLPMSTTPDNASVNSNTNYSIKKSRSNSTLPVASPTTSTSSVVVSGGGGVLNSQSTSDDEHLEINSGSSRISSQSEQCNKTRHNKKSVKVQGNRGKESSGSHKHHRKSPLFSNKPYQNHTKLNYQAQIEENCDSPLDFSTKKIKLEIPDPSNNNNYSTRYHHLNNRDQDPRIKEDVEEEIDEEQEEEETSPATDNNICGGKSRLRNMLSMKSPSVYESMPGTILNLSKADSPTSGRHARTGSGTGAAHTSWLLSPTRSGSRGSSSCGSNSSSPGLESQQQQLQLLQLQQQQQIQMQLHANNYILSPRSSGSAGSAGSGSGSGSGGASNNDLGVGGVNGSVIPSLNAAAAAALGPSQAALSVTTASSGLHHPMSYSPYGSVFGPGLSPVMNQTVPSGASLPLSFDTSPPIFSHHITASSASPNLPFGTQGLSANPPTSLSGVGTNVTISHGSSKARTTRPFKAYPKDPMSFSAVGLYGLPLGTSPTSTEAMILQQSNVAYNEFRNQMLSQSQSGKSRRGGQRSVNGLSDSMISSPNDSINFGLGAVPMDCGNNSSAEESHSAPEDGVSKGCGGSSLGKTEQQLKDEAYWERRRKNNEAAKRSRDARRAKEDEIAIRAAFLEQENLKLRFELCALKNETAKLRCMLYSS